ncbi:MAG TPA: outer membrane lipoprotein-sorting protein, partial [Solimonas sp.]|nr:outer membrane lipoprotein-sorting protein [Solimonas sp.]
AMLKIGAPADLAGAAYLMREGEKVDEIYIFVPALNKVRRVTGGSMDGPLWGTDLSYNDLKQVQNSFSDPNARLEGKGEIDGTAVQILQFTPQPGQSTRYTTIRAWVEPKSCMALKAEFYEGAVVRKRFSGAPKDLKQAGTTWYLSDMTVADLKEGTQTRIRVTGVAAGKDLADRLFNPGTFHVGN